VKSGQKVKPTIVFVHGTGVRKDGYLQSFAILQRALADYDVGCDLVPCLWGDDLGATMPHMSLPKEAVSTEFTPSSTKEQDRARWELLYQDPFFEIHLLRLRPKSSTLYPPNVVLEAEEVWQRIDRYTPSAKLKRFLAAWNLEDYWKISFERVVHENRFVREVFLASPKDMGETTQAVVRAILAVIAILAMDNHSSQLNSEQRDQLFDILLDDWRARVAGLGSYVAGFLANVVSAVGTPLAAGGRADWTARATPAGGDILLYQVRGEAIRNYIRLTVERTVKKTKNPVILLGHSLGGIACVDLLASEKVPNVSHLITVGSQAPYLYEIGALQSMTFSPRQSLPDHFPPWLNLYDRYDFLSFEGERLFGDRIRDARIDSGQPFPASHGAYWTNPVTWHHVTEFLRCR
jgi:hypothetical protein